MIAQYHMEDIEFDENFDLEEEEDDEEILLCYDCKIKFLDESELYDHLLIHVKQPKVLLKPLRQAPIRITLKSKRNNSFEIVNSPQSSHSSTNTSEEIDSPDEGPDDIPATDLADVEVDNNEDGTTEDDNNESTSPINNDPDEQSDTEPDGENEPDREVEIEGEAEDQAEADQAETEDQAESEDQAEADDQAESDDQPEAEDQAEAEDQGETEDHSEVEEQSEAEDQSEVEGEGDVEVESEIEGEIEDEMPDEEEISEGDYEENVESDTVDIEQDTEESTSQDAPAEVEETEQEIDEAMVVNDESVDYSNVPGGEPTPPPDSSPERNTDYPKIRIKSGLLKERLTITEINDDNPNGELRELRRSREKRKDPYMHSGDWTTPLEDPLKINDPLSFDRDDGKLISSLFNNHNDRAKDLGFTTSDNEFISMDRMDDRNRNALQVYSSNNQPLPHSPLDSLARLPMQQLAQQVSRLQPSNGMHQQNVLINIQQFPQAPPQPPPPHHGYLPPSYQYMPPTSMYPYPPAPPYPPYMPPPPPRPPMPQQPMPGMQPPPPSYRQAMQQPRPNLGPRPQMPPSRSSMNPRQSLPSRPQAVAIRQRVPPQRIRPGSAIREQRPKMSSHMSQNGQYITNNQGQKVLVKRHPEQMHNLHAKRKRMDILMPNKNDDADCQLISVQPKNSGLPQIQSVQGNVQDQADNGVMHLSDSITLSVRNPPPKSASPKKSDAKVVANILATRGITVTATPKQKEKQQKMAAEAVAINLNSAVSIIPAKVGSKGDKVQTFDLTDDNQVDDVPAPLPPPKPVVKPPQPKNVQRGLPFRCDLCPAQYPNALGLNKHRQSFHKTGGPCEYGIPIIDLKQPGILQKLNAIGISNYIPVSGSNDYCLGLPIVNANMIKSTNMNAIGATKILSLGPIRSFPRSHHINK